MPRFDAYVYRARYTHGGRASLPRFHPQFELWSPAPPRSGHKRTGLWQRPPGLHEQVSMSGC